MVTLSLLVGFVQMCSPAPIDRTIACSQWFIQCYSDLADPRLKEDSNAIEICVEQLPTDISPN